MYDVIIVGAGPAGATLARLVGARLKVLVLDRRELGKPFSGGPEKCCGGLLAPDAQKMLARFGLGLPKAIMADPQLFAVRVLDLVSGQTRYYPRHYINVNREDFDRWLVSLLPSAVSACWGANLTGFCQEPSQVRVQYRQAGEMREAAAKLLVGADGALSSIRAGLGLRPGPRYVAIQESFSVAKALPYYTSIFDREITDFYAWMIPKNGALLVGAALPETQCQAKFNLLLTKLGEKGFDLSHSLRRRGTFLLRPLAGRGIALGKGRAALIGEAAAWISPSSAEGISYAFRSAFALSQALDKGFAGCLGRYRRLTRSLKLNIFAKTSKCPPMYWPLLRRWAMGSGFSSIGIADKHQGG